MFLILVDPCPKAVIWSQRVKCRPQPHPGCPAEGAAAWEEGLGQILRTADPVTGIRGRVQSWGSGAEKHLGELAQGLPSPLSPSVPARCSEEGRTCWKQGPQPTSGSHPAPIQLGTMASLLSQQTPLCPTNRGRGPQHSQTPLPEAPELLPCYLGERLHC